MNLEEDFRNLKVGDVFHAWYDARHGQTGSAICLVTQADAHTITARSVMTHMVLTFERATLVGTCGNGRASCIVSSAGRLPDDIRDVVLEMDRKFDPSNPAADTKLTGAQIDALLFLSRHYRE